MAKSSSVQGPDVRSARRTLRLTFRIADQEVRLQSFERQDMICPPAVGSVPEAGKNGGYWIELRDSKNRLLFHRILNHPLGDSVEVHSPEGKIERVYGVVAENVFEVLVPDDPRARSIVFVGESLVPLPQRKEKPSAARELARFDVPGTTRGNVEQEGGSHDRR